MTQRQVSADWVPGPLRCAVLTEGDFIIAVDEPESAGGTGLGPQPTDLFLASIASCFTLAVVYSAQRLGLDIAGVEVDVVGDYDGPRFAGVEIITRIGGIDDGQLARLVTSAERVCYVTQTLRRPPTITVTASARTGAEMTRSGGATEPP
jgi:putative redox protein